MSLLIKALEQAAKDRKAGRVEPPAGDAVPATDGERPAPAAVGAPSGALSEPSIEPAPPPRGPPRPQAPSRAAAPPPRAAAAPSVAANPQAAERPAAAPRRAATSLSELQETDAREQRARAAAVMQAGSGAASQAIAFLRANPVIMFGTIAVAVGLFFGIYVYLQVANPRLFMRQAATRPQEPQPPAPPAPTEAPPPADAAQPGAPAPVAAAPAPQQPAQPPQPALPPGAAALSGTIGAPAPAPAPVLATAPPGQVPASAVVATAPPMDMPRALPAERAPERRAPRARAADDEDAPARAAPSRAAPAAEPGGRERISVSPSAAQPRVNPQVAQAYNLMQSGNLDEARATYTKVTQSEPLNIDALLGLAYIAAQENRTDDALRNYLRILQLNPRHAVAQAALIGLMGRADPAASESRLRQLIAREPSPFLHFILGNLYADQGQWSQAQQAYFQAHVLEPDNPDYAYNLAVGLDQLRQTKLALNYYRRAEQLAQARGQSNFNLSHAQERIRTLNSQLE